MKFGDVKSRTLKIKTWVNIVVLVKQQQHHTLWGQTCRWACNSLPQQAITRYTCAFNVHTNIITVLDNVVLVTTINNLRHTYTASMYM